MLFFPFAPVKAFPQILLTPIVEDGRSILKKLIFLFSQQIRLYMFSVVIAVSYFSPFSSSITKSALNFGLNVFLFLDIVNPLFSGFYYISFIKIKVRNCLNL